MRAIGAVSANVGKSTTTTLPFYLRLPLLATATLSFTSRFVRASSRSSQPITGVRGVVGG